MLPAIPVPEDYEVSSLHGFLPASPPLEVLPDAYYQPWEVVLKSLQGLILSGRLRGVVDGLPVLSTEFLHTEAEWRRAYSLLGFLLHGYVWGGTKPAEVIPPSISVPFLACCERLELPPVATYAGLVLWNFKPLFANEGIDVLENLSTLATITGSLDESWFYLISVVIEARGGPVIPLMLRAIAAARVGDTLTVTECLRSFAERLDELGRLLERMYENCDPHVFYHRIRPYLAGSKNMHDAGLPQGVRFDTGVDPPNPFVQYAGGSNAQSSLIQFFDLVLGVQHLPTGSSRTSSSASDSDSRPPTSRNPSLPAHNFISEMRTYMPGPHRRFLSQVALVANIRDCVDTHPADKALSGAYDACLAMLRTFRDTHIQMVSRYIVIKSRDPPPQLSATKLQNNATTTPSPLQPLQPSQPQRLNLANARSRPGGKPRRLRGTGGTALISFLKQARDETGEQAVGDWARRLLTNAPVAPLGTVDEHANGRVEIVGLAGTWSVDDSEGGICHW